MEKSDRSNTLILFQQKTIKFIQANSVISLFALFIWALGVPGVQNAYARGWSLGLTTLFCHFIGCCILLITSTIIEKIARKFHKLTRLKLAIVSIFWIFFIYSIFRLYQAFQIMGSGS
jgi:hypothetical protein